MAKERIEWIDLAKGFCIILIVYQHTGLMSIPYLGQWFINFNIPVFFFLSGICFSQDKYPTFGSLLIRRWKTLVRPYLIFSVIVAGMMFIVDDNFDIERVKGILITGWGGIALWFIPVLFITTLMWYFISKYIRNVKLQTIIMLFVGIIGYISYRLKLPNNYNAWFSLTALLFYGTGNLVKTIFGKLPKYQLIMQWGG